ncbi:MAG: gas vesicle protein [Pseudomonadota bacterium]
MSGEIQSPIGRDSLADVLERVLEKGVVVAGDVTVAIAGVELLTVKIRLLVTTVDKAIDLGLDWWRNDPMLSTASALEAQARADHLAGPRTDDRVLAALETIDRRLAALEAPDPDRPKGDRAGGTMGTRAPRGPTP